MYHIAVPGTASFMIMNFFLQYIMTQTDIFFQNGGKEKWIFLEKHYSSLFKIKG